MLFLFREREKRLTPKKDEWKTEPEEQWFARMLSDTALLIHVLKACLVIDFREC
jgi:hypothetical protein